MEWTGPMEKNRKGYLGTEGPPAQGSSARKISLHNFWLQKPVRIEAVEDKLPESQAILLKEPPHRLTQTYSLWTPAQRQQTERHQRHTGKNWSVQHAGESWEAVFSQIEVLAEATLSFLSPHTTEPESQQAGTISETPSTWLTQFVPSWWLLEALPHWTFKPTQAVSIGFSTWMVCLGSCFSKPDTSC